MPSLLLVLTSSQLLSYYCCYGVVHPFFPYGIERVSESGLTVPSQRRRLLPRLRSAASLVSALAAVGILLRRACLGPLFLPLQLVKQEPVRTVQSHALKGKTSVQNSDNNHSSGRGWYLCGRDKHKGVFLIVQSSQQKTKKGRQSYECTWYVGFEELGRRVEGNRIDFL